MRLSVSVTHDHAVPFQLSAILRKLADLAEEGKLPSMVIDDDGNKLADVIAADPAKQLPNLVGAVFLNEMPHA
jgi:hypothetical protein